jgi:hypothetical protein
MLIRTFRQPCRWLYMAIVELIKQRGVYVDCCFLHLLAHYTITCGIQNQLVHVFQDVCASSDCPAPYQSQCCPVIIDLLNSAENMCFTSCSSLQTIRLSC